MESARPVDGALLEVRDLQFTWPKSGGEGVHLASLALMPGERLFVAGPSGSGKSTLLSLLAGVVLPRSGTVHLLGKDWAGLSGAQRDRFRADHVGYIFQQFNLLPYLSVLDNVLLPCRFSRLRASRSGDALAEAKRLLEQAGLDAALRSRPASSLSVGQQQRVAAVRALLGRPELVIADEPTSALDEPLRESFMDLLLRTCDAAGSALVFVSHDVRLATRFGRALALGGGS